MELKLGKAPARDGAVKFKIENYLDLSALPPIPTGPFGHMESVTQPWGMLGNDTVGCCVISGGGHEHMVLNAENGRTVTFDTPATLSDYTAITGWDPSEPASDQGTDVATALEYRRTTGLVDASGVRHKIGAYIALDPGNQRQLFAALRLFNTVAIGYELPVSAMDDFRAGRPWTYRRRSKIEGGHYVPGFDHLDYAGNLGSVSWGAKVIIAPSFFGHYCDEAYAIISQEELDGAGKSPEAFDWAQLRADLPAVAHLR